MAFKQFSKYLAEKQGMYFVLRNDLDYADVVFLYQSYEDMVVCDAHYLKTSGYDGYVQCCMDDYHQCPACSYGEKGISKQTKLFIPLFNLTKGTLEFWDRNSTFESVINESVFKNYPNPSEYVFRVIRHGKSRDVNTKYEIVPQGRNSGYPYAKILSDYNITFPEGYDTICKAMTPEEMAGYLSNHGQVSNLGDYNYTPVPRGTYNSQSSSMDVVPEPPQIEVPTPTYSAPPTDLPDYSIGTPADASPLVADTSVSPMVENTPAGDVDDVDDVNF